MKEPYFTPESIDQVAREMLQEVRELRERHPWRLQLERAGLLVLDMQRYFLEKDSHAYVPSAEAILPRARELAATFAARGRPVVFTRHLNTEEDAGQMARWWGELLKRENPLSELAPELDTELGIVIEKSQYDAFYGTELEKLLREKNVEQLVICGVMVHLCCETTARSGFCRGFEVFFVVDGTATYNERFHRATLLNLAHGFAHPVLAEEVLAALRDG